MHLNYFYYAIYFPPPPTCGGRCTVQSFGATVYFYGLWTGGR